MTIDTARRTRRPNVLGRSGASVVKYFMFNSGCLSARSGANRRVLLRNTRVMVARTRACALASHTRNPHQRCGRSGAGAQPPHPVSRSARPHSRPRQKAVSSASVRPSVPGVVTGDNFAGCAASCAGYAESQSSRSTSVWSVMMDATDGLVSSISSSEPAESRFSSPTPPPPSLAPGTASSTTTWLSSSSSPRPPAAAAAATATAAAGSARCTAA